MRTSNKILTGLLLVTILVFCSLFTLVRVKYANGNIVKRDRVNSWSDVHRINEPIKRVSISYLSNLMIIPSDSIRLEISKEERGHIKWRVEDGVLFVESDTIRENGNGRDNHAYGHVELFLPDVDSIYAWNGNINIKNIAERGNISPKYNFQLKGINMTIESDAIKEDTTFYDKFSINASNCSIRFQDNVQVNELQLKLRKTQLVEEHSVFNNLSIQTDSTSSITLSAHNLLKAKITSTE